MQKLFLSPWTPVHEVIDLKNCTVKLICLDDSTPGVEQELIIKVGEGTFTWTEKVNREYKLDRGTLNTVRDGDEEPVEWSLDLSWDWIQGTSEAPEADGIAELKAFLKGDSTHVTIDSADACAPYAFKIQVEYVPDCGDTGGKDIVLDKCRIESLQYDIGAGTISASGRANVTEATITDVETSA